MNVTLWDKIEKFDLIFPSSEYGFATRLAYENRWTDYFTQRAIDEYKKFMFLAATSNQMVSPSEIVDIVWHQHLIFTESYKEFCIILGKKIEHIPSTHDKNEKDKFLKAKKITQELYEQSFGNQPKEYWENNTFIDSIAIEKSKLEISYIWILALPFILLLVITFRYAFYDLYLSIKNPLFVFLYVLACISIFSFLFLYNQKELKKTVIETFPNSVIDNLTPAELIVMETTEIKSIIHGYVNYLIVEKYLRVDPLSNKIKLIANDIENPNPIFRVIIDSFEDNQAISYKELLNKLIYKPIISKSYSASTMIAEKIRKSKRVVNVFLINIAILSFLSAFGLTRTLIGYIRGKEIAYIMLINLAVLFLAYKFLDYLITVLPNKIIPNYFKKDIIPSSSDKKGYNNWEWNYFIFGTALLSMTFKSVASPYMTNDSANSFRGSEGTSCGSSCGGGCGGGCGGCGGCGS